MDLDITIGIFQKLLIIGKKNIDDIDDTNDSYRSGDLDGTAILVHDPLELLNISMTNEKDKPAQLRRTPADRFKVKIRPQPYSRTTTKISPSTMKSKNRKVKYKEYKHPSVKKVCATLSNIILPWEVSRLNINPAVAMTSSEVYNFYAEKIKKFSDTLSKMKITKIDGNENFNVNFTCCDDDFEISESYGKQLTALKEKLSKVLVRKSNLNYEVLRGSQVIQTEELQQKRSEQYNNPVPIIKNLTNQPIANENVRYHVTSKFVSTGMHPSVQILRRNFKSIAIPYEVLQCNIDPCIVLNSGEVIEWYSNRLEYYKEELQREKSKGRARCSTETRHKSQKHPSSRRSVAKYMNFCELDSSDSESDRRKSVYKQQIHKTYGIQIKNDQISEASRNSMESVSNINHIIPTREASASLVVHIDNEENILPHRKRKVVPLTESDEEVEPIPKKPNCTSNNIIINYMNKEVAQDVQQNLLDQMFNIGVERFMCEFCCAVFDEKKHLTEHTRQHLSCKSCRKRIKNKEAMRKHLIHHCSLNSIQNKPILKLERIDSVPSMLEKYARAFAEPVYDEPEIPVTSQDTNNSVFCASKYRPITTNPNLLVTQTPNTFIDGSDQNNITINHMGTQRTYCKQVQGTTIRLVKATEGSNITTNQNNFVYQTNQKPTVQLKNTISSNLNKILLLNNVSQDPSSSVLYGTLIVNNANGQPSSVCLTSANTTFAPSTANTISPEIMNPSCSNPDLQQPAPFMQIVEPANTSMVQYIDPVMQNGNTLVTFQHQDHTYPQPHTNQLFQNGTNLNNIVFVSTNSAPETQLQCSSVNTTTETFFGEATTTQAASTDFLLPENVTNSASNNPAQNQFRIRVKSIQELR